MNYALSIQVDSAPRGIRLDWLHSVYVWTVERHNYFKSGAELYKIFIPFLVIMVYTSLLQKEFVLSAVCMWKNKL
jgi:hypothetical protein